MQKALIFYLVFLVSVNTFAQSHITVTGKVVDKQEGNALSGATVAIKGTNIMAFTNDNGVYRFRSQVTGDVILLISHVGYETVEIVSRTSDTSLIVNAALIPYNNIGNSIVISASKQPEKITNAPASIQLITSKDLKQFAGSNVNELAAKIPGVEYTRSGVDEINFNARGLNTAFNIKVMQLVDGRNSISPLSGGIAVFNNGSTNKEDIKQIEILLGPQTALYGPNAHNILFNYITKDPFTYQGTTFAVSAGSQGQFSSRLRHAVKINDKWAYKLTGEFATGRDYSWYDTVYAGNQPPGNAPIFGPPVSIPERISSFTFHRYRGEGHVYYKIAPKTQVIVSAGGSKFTRLQVTTTGRNQLKDASYSFIQARVTHPRYYVNLYNTWGNLGKTLIIPNYTRDYWNSTYRGIPPDSAETFARRLGNTVIEESQRLNADMQYNYRFKEAGLFLVAGLSYQKDKPYSFGISLVDSFQRITTTQYGAVLQLEKSLPWNLRLIGAARLDFHSNFGTFLSPRFAISKDISEGSFRITFGRAYSMPSILNQYAGISRFLFGNGEGIRYIPNGNNVKEAQFYRITTPLKPEQVNTLEFGYKGRLTEKLYVDINFYNGVSENFISPPITVSGRVLNVGEVAVTHNPLFAGSIVRDTLRNARFLTYFNYGAVRTYGSDLGLNYTFSRYFSAGIRYSWFGSDITEEDIKNDANGDNYVSPEERSLNAPVNRGALLLNFQNLCKGKLVASASIRYVQQYDFYSGEQIGTESGKGRRGFISRPGQSPLLKNFDWGPLGGFTSVDISAGYQFNEMISGNFGITNLFNSRQIEFVGSPSIGRLIMAELKVHVPSGRKQD
jgi:iron complex outermembrane receptor protein